MTTYILDLSYFTCEMGTNLIKTVDWNESRQASRAPFRGPVAQSLTLKLSMSSLEVGGKEKKKQNKIKT